jgi:hypothetical protein
VSRAALALAVALSAAAAAPADELPPNLTAEAGVRDPVFSLLIGLLRSGAHGALTQERLTRELGARAGSTRLPFHSLLELERRAGGVADRVTARFDGPLDIAAPYSLLGYHPGRVRASQRCVLEDWALGEERVPRHDLLLQDVHLLRLVEGRILLDIDGWLDALMGAALDDTEVAGLALFRYQGRWIGLALGRNLRGESRTGALDFTADRVLFPFPADLRLAGHHLRTRLESLGVGALPRGPVQHKVPTLPRQGQLEPVAGRPGEEAVQAPDRLRVPGEVGS